MSQAKPQWQLQALAAQRRDNELRRAEELRKVADYFETNTNKSRHHELWTTDDYYERAKKEAEILRQKKMRSAKLEERRKKLELMLFQENMQYQQELKMLAAQPKYYRNGSYLNKVPTSTLQEINQGIMEKEEQLRRHEAELRLHHAWRLRQPELRAANTYLANGKLKSAWMEQIVEKELQKKKEEEETRKCLQERDEALRRQIQIEEERLKEKELQMKELRESLEGQIGELSEKETVVKKLRKQEEKEKMILDELLFISEEREREHARLLAERDTNIVNMGLHKYKLKRKVAAVMKEIELDLKMLDKLQRAVVKDFECEEEKCASSKRVVQAALAQVEQCRERERQRQKNIEVMYDGEARQINEKQDKLWEKEREARAVLMRDVVKSLRRQVEEKIEAGRQQQRDNVLEREKILQEMEDFHQQVRAKERESQLKNTEYSTIAALQSQLNGLRVEKEKLEEVVEREADVRAAIHNEKKLRIEIARMHREGRGEAGGAMACAGCEKPILDKFLLHVLERAWHAACVRCADCRAPLSDKCYSRDNKLFCRNDFFRRYGTKCSGCGHGISPSDLVRKAREKVFHLNCFTCLVCRKQLSTGEELYVLDDNKFICKEDYLAGKAPTHSDSLLGSGSDEEEEDEARAANSASSPAHAPHPALHPDLAHNGDTKPHEDSEDQGSLDGDPETRDSQAENKSPDDGNGGSKRRGPRTTIKAKQLEILKSAFSQTPKPTRHIREQLAKETGLPMRVIQVWFQNKRSKERRLKQLTSMGRGPFFGSSRKMRGFPMNLSPGGLEEGPPGFPYFATADGKFEFGYGPPFHHDAPFFHPPPAMPFNQPGGMESLPGGEFPEQFPPPDHLVLPRPSSPEFTFGDAPPPLHPEGLVW